MNVESCISQFREFTIQNQGSWRMLRVGTLIDLVNMEAVKHLRKGTQESAISLFHYSLCLLYNHLYGVHNFEVFFNEDLNDADLREINNGAEKICRGIIVNNNLVCKSLEDELNYLSQVKLLDYEPVLKNCVSCILKSTLNLI